MNDEDVGNLPLSSYLLGSVVLDFAGRISVCVKRAGESQAEVGRLVGVTRSAVSQWVSGTSEPSPANALMLARVARVRPEWLILGEEPMEAVRIPPELLRALLRTLEGAPDDKIREVINFAGYSTQQ